MPLRRRLTWMSAGIVGLAVLFAAVACYLAVRHELYAKTDEALRTQATLIESAASRFERLPPRLPEPPQPAGGAAGYTQILARDGTVMRSSRELEIAVTSEDRAVAAGDDPTYISDRHQGDVHLRVITVPLSGGGAVLLGRALNSTDSVLARLRLILLVVCVLALALATGLARLLTRPVLAPVRELTATADHIAATGDLRRRIAVGESDDEVSQMAHRFNAMLDELESSQLALAESMRDQRRLIADASHELRTPIASLRTNIEVLLEGVPTETKAREALLGDVVLQSEELTALVANLIELAREGDQGGEPEAFRLDEVVREAVERAHRHAPGIRFDEALEEVTIDGYPERVARAVNNLLDNAAKFNPPGSTVVVALVGPELSVRDHGPGVPEGELPHLFDRFWRGDNGRRRHGSGLGLAIVKQVAELHHGSVVAELPPDGGLLIRLRLGEQPPSANSSLSHREPVSERA
jgi:two-component system sensor histidine kinase MprB